MPDFLTILYQEPIEQSSNHSEAPKVLRVELESRSPKLDRPRQEIPQKGR